jgi:hypothetical protein
MHTRYSDPGHYAPLLDALPTAIRALTAVVRNVLVHYVAAGIAFTGDRLAEIDNRWVDRILATDQSRFPLPLHAPRPQAERVAGCCRDFTLLTVAALRQHGTPARSRVGFASYLGPGWNYDHVVVEYRAGGRWAFTDAQLDPAGDWPVDPADLPRPVDERSPFATAARVWTAYRRGAVDPGRYGVAPDSPHRGARLIRDYVIAELAHRQGDELLLWDAWGAMDDDVEATTALVDEVAGLLLAADGGDVGAERELADRYAADGRLRPGRQVRSHSPTGTGRVVDLRTRASA